MNGIVQRMRAGVRGALAAAMLGGMIASAAAQVTVGGGSGTGGSNLIAFGDQQVNATKVMFVTLTSTGTNVTYGVLDTSTLTGTPFSVTVPDNGCSGQTINDTSSCTIAVRFTPTAETSYATYFRLAVSMPANHPGVFINLTGKGITGGASTAGTLTITPASPITISAATGQLPTQLLTLAATGGNVAISGISLPTGWQMDNLCGSSVRPGADCVINLKPIVPGTAGTYPYSVVIQASDKAHVLSVTLNVSETAAATQGQLTMSPATLDFGSVRPGYKSVKSFTLTASTANVAFTGISVPTGFTVVHTCGTLIPAGGSCTGAVTFAPTEEISYAGSAVINSSAQNAPHFVKLSGVGSSTAGLASLMTISPASLDFGVVRPGSKLAKSVTITAGGANVAFDGISLPSGFTASHSCGTLIPAGGTCSATITFAPTAKIPYDGSAVISVTGQTAPHFITLKASGGDATGGGSSPALLILGQSLLDFGDVVAGSTKTLQITMANRGGTVLDANWLRTNTAFTPVSGGCLSSATITIAAGTSCTLTVQFKPAQIGSEIGSIRFSGTGADDVELSLKGRGIGGVNTTTGGVLVSSSSHVTFGAVATGTSLVKTVTLRTSGGSVRPALIGVGVPEGFAASHDCATAVGTTCTLTLAFTPREIKDYQGFVIADAKDGSAAFITVSGTGTGASGVQMSATSRGDRQAQSLTGQFRFPGALTNSEGNLYVALLKGDELYFQSNGQWRPYQPGFEPGPYVSGQLQNTDLTILSGQDVSRFSGAVLYLGYGRNLNELLANRQYAPVFVIE